MFKQEQPPKQSQGITLSSSVEETIIGPETKYQGTVTTSKSIRVDGLFEGEIKSGGHVIVGKTGRFKGKIECQSLYASGLVEADMTIFEKLECTKECVLKGDITVKEIILAPGAVFDGKCTMSKFNAVTIEDKPE